MRLSVVSLFVVGTLLLIPSTSQSAELMGGGQVEYKRYDNDCNHAWGSAECDSNETLICTEGERIEVAKINSVSPEKFPSHNYDVNVASGELYPLTVDIYLCVR